MDRRFENLKKLGLTDEEVKDVLNADKRIDKGEKLFELSAEQKLAEKAARSTGTRAPTVYNFTPRERKPNEVKRVIMETIITAVSALADENSLDITNAEREFVFKVSGVKYKIVLSAPRS